MKKLAYLISILFDPILLIPALFWLIVNETTASAFSFINWLTLAIFYLVLPMAAFLWFLRTGRIRDWWMSRREDRYLIYFLVLIFHAGAVLMAWLWLGQKELAKVFGTFWILLLSLTLANFYTKVSLHAAVSSAVAWWLTAYFGWEKWWWFWFAVLAVAWSRYHLKKHTISQSLLAIFLTVFILQFVSMIL